MLRRKAYQALLDWKNRNSKKALCVFGARQVGKTTLIREFARAEYPHFVEINFLTDPQARDIFSGSLSADSLIANLTAFIRQPLVEHQTI